MRRDEIAQYAYENVPFYKELVNEEIGQWENYPVVDKRMVGQRMDAVFSAEYILDYLSDRLERVLTSGSSGDCLEIYWKKGQNIKSLLSLWAKRKKYYGILPDDRRCYFFTTKIVDGKEVEYEETENGLGFNKMNLSEDKVLDIYKRMLEFNPKWMIMQPSMVLLLMNVVRKHDLPQISGLTYIELTGERVIRATEDLIKQFFDCKVASQYGCYETNSIAYECPCGEMHVMSENVYVEIIGEDDLCITSLHNKVMPFIRYKIGDKGKLIKNNKCPCGSKEPIVQLKMARENDWIYNQNGTKCHSDLFCNVIDKINLGMQQVIMQYQIIQTDYQEFEVYLVINDESEKAVIQKLFIEYYENYQERSSFQFFFVDYLYPSEKTGKLAWFVSKVKEH